MKDKEMKRLCTYLTGVMAFISFMISVWFINILTVPAAATSSNADRATPTDADRINEQILNLLDEVKFDDLDEQQQLELFSLYMQSLSGPGIASGSNVVLEHMESLLADIHAEIVPASSESEESISAFSLENTEGVMLLSLSDDFSLNRNVVIYEGIWNGQSARLVLPAAVSSTLYIDDSGYLYNVGLDSVTGRLFYGDFDPLDYEIDAFTLTPCLGNNASTLYSNGYPSYNRHYYYSSGSLKNSYTYGLFTVTKVVHTLSDLPDDKNGIYLLVLILIGGVSVLCLWKKSRN